MNFIDLFFGDKTTTLVAPTEIGMTCQSIDTLLQFYVSAFSFTLISRIDVPARAAALTPLSQCGYTVVRLQSPFGERLKLLSPASLVSYRASTRPSENILDGAHTIFITLIVADLTATRDRAIALGATAMGDNVHIRPDLRIGFLCHPEGNYLELAEYAKVSDYRADL